MAKTVKPFVCLVEGCEERKMTEREIFGHMIIKHHIKAEYKIEKKTGKVVLVQRPAVKAEAQQGWKDAWRKSDNEWRKKLAAGIIDEWGTTVTKSGWRKGVPKNKEKRAKMLEQEKISKESKCVGKKGHRIVEVITEKPKRKRKRVQGLSEDEDPGENPDDLKDMAEKAEEELQASGYDIGSKLSKPLEKSTSSKESVEKEGEVGAHSTPKMKTTKEIRKQQVAEIMQQAKDRIKQSLEKRKSEIDVQIPGTDGSVIDFRKIMVEPKELKVSLKRTEVGLGDVEWRERQRLKEEELKKRVVQPNVETAEALRQAKIQRSKEFWKEIQVYENLEAGKDVQVMSVTKEVVTDKPGERPVTGKSTEREPESRIAMERVKTAVDIQVRGQKMLSEVKDYFEQGSSRTVQTNVVMKDPVSEEDKHRESERESSEVEGETDLEVIQQITKKKTPDEKRIVSKEVDGKLVFVEMVKIDDLIARDMQREKEEKEKEAKETLVANERLQFQTLLAQQIEMSVGLVQKIVADQDPVRQAERMEFLKQLIRGLGFIGDVQLRRMMPDSEKLGFIEFLEAHEREMKERLNKERQEDLMLREKRHQELLAKEAERLHVQMTKRLNEEERKERWYREDIRTRSSLRSVRKALDLEVSPSSMDEADQRDPKKKLRYEKRIKEFRLEYRAVTDSEGELTEVERQERRRKRRAVRGKRKLNLSEWRRVDDDDDD